jgi:predicted nucleic acid-binding protein
MVTAIVKPSSVINQLREQAGFRIAPTLLADILRESEEEQ